MLGLWVEQTEGAKFWLKVFNELKTRGLADILIAVVDIKDRGHFPTDEAPTKLIWLALRNVLAKLIRPTCDWKIAMNQFAVLFGERFILARA